MTRSNPNIVGGVDLEATLAELAILRTGMEMIAEGGTDDPAGFAEIVLGKADAQNA